MLIELNRFMTAEQVRTLYQIPDDLYPKLLPLLPVAYRDGAGVPYYLESVVDRFLQRWAEAAAEPDGPVPPDRFRIGTSVCRGLTSLEWRLLDCLWGKPAVPIGEVQDHVYGHDSEQSDDALRKVMCRLNDKLAKQGRPAEVDSKGGVLPPDPSWSPVTVSK